MEKRTKRRQQIAVLFAVVVIVCAVFATFGTNSAQAKTTVPKATVKLVKKGATVKAGDLKYKVTNLSKNKKTVVVTGAAKKNLKKAVVPATIKITSKKGTFKGTYTYKVTGIRAKAFQKNKTITSVKIGSNVTSVGSKAFFKCKALKKVSLGKKVKKIGSYAFAHCSKLSKVAVPKNSELKTIGKYAFYKDGKLKTMNLKNAKNLTKVHKTALEGTKIKDPTAKDKKKSTDKKDDSKKDDSKKEKTAADYSYEITPLLAPFNEYFYIKTDNPDPDSFRFVDNSTKYREDSEDPGTITPIQMEYADVVYENKKTFRVKGGYLASGDNTDGGQLRLQSATVTGSYPMHNLSTGEITTEYEYEYKDTGIKVKVASLMDEADYLIKTYSGSATGFFEKMDNIQSGFSEICLYSGVAVKGSLKKGDSKWGISTSPHADQDFYIQDPYYRADDGMPMFISYLYPFRYDSLGFPGMMGSIAQRLNAAATYQWTETHYLIDVTLNGTTRSYGGAGYGGGQGIRKKDIMYYFKFDGSAADTAKDKTLTSIKKKICAYGDLNIPEEKKEGEITWEDVNKKVGEGAYVKVALLTSVYFGVSDTGFSYMYDAGYSMPGYISNAWYDGRYFNKWEYFYPGAKFEETIDTEEPALIIKDFKAKLPDDGNDYQIYWADYDKDTGVWKGYTRFDYDSESKTWKADFLGSIDYYSEEDYQYHNIEDPDFLDACTITMDEAKAMKPDRNTNTDPTTYYSYDMEENPGTFHKG